MDQENKKNNIDWQVLKTKAGKAMKFIRKQNIIVTTSVGALGLAIIIGLVYLLIGSDYKGTTSTTIAFNYEGVDKGLDPYGKTFDISEIKSKPILDQTIEKLGLKDKGITPEELERNIVISSIMPEDVMDRMLVIAPGNKDASKLEKLAELEYHPVEYMVSIRIPKEFHINSNTSNEILDTLIANYRTYFIAKYSDKHALNSAAISVDIKKYDYPEFAMLVKSQLNVIRNYIELKEAVAGDFRAETTNLSFGDLLAQLEVLQSVDLNRINSLVNSFNLTKDSEKLIAIYQNRVTQMEITVKQKQEEATQIREQVNSYKKDKNIMVMSGDNTVEGAQVVQGSETYDNLVRQATYAANEAIRLHHDIAYYNKLINQIQNKQIAGGTTADVDIAKYTKEVDTQIGEFSKNIQAFVGVANQTVDDYFEKEIFKDAIKVSNPADFHSTFRETLKIGICLGALVIFIGVIVGVLITLIRKVFHGKEKNCSL
ncbi:MAG: hypothetical protein AB9856_14955 [Cellulosilyticaceae bacterium]